MEIIRAGSKGGVEIRVPTTPINTGRVTPDRWDRARRPFEIWPTQERANITTTETAFHCLADRTT